jgi:hypothetical protein
LRNASARRPSNPACHVAEDQSGFRASQFQSSAPVLAAGVEFFQLQNRQQIPPHLVRFDYEDFHGVEAGLC